MYICMPLVTYDELRLFPVPKPHDLTSVMVQAVRHRRLTAEARDTPVQSVWDLWWTKWRWHAFSSIRPTSVFPCQYYSTGVPC
jgi:hypothetical protein